MQRLERFEKALQNIINEYDNLGRELEKLRSDFLKIYKITIYRAGN